jgi:glycosyltransferase involved in cell wall biosynthesis
VNSSSKIIHPEFNPLLKPKILLVLHIPPPVHGAAVIGDFIKNSKALNNAFECHYVNLSTSISLEEIGKNFLKKLSRYFSIILQVRKSIYEFKPDVCYITAYSGGIGFYKDLVIITLLKLSGKKIVYHFHNKGVRLRQSRFFDNILYRFAFRNTHVILLSGLLYPDFQKYFPEKKVLYCPNGIPDVSDSQRGIYGEKNIKTPQLLFLSNFFRSKGIFCLIEACLILKKMELDFHCTIAGGEGDISVSDIKNVISSKGLNSQVTVTSGKFGNEKIEILKKSDIFVFPTYSDCMPLVLIEAMQFSLPVVSTIEGAIPDIVDDGITGFIIPPKDSNALAEKLEILIRDPELRKSMGEEGRKKYLKEFTLEKFENRMMEILEEVAGA